MLKGPYPAGLSTYQLISLSTYQPKNLSTFQTTYRQLSATRALPLFAQPWWLDAVCPGGWDAAITDKGGVVTGVWPYALQRKMGVTLLRTPALTPYLGPLVFFPEDLKSGNRDGFEHEAIAALLAQLPPAQVCLLSLPPGLKQAGLFGSHGFDLAARQTFLLDLSLPESVLLGGFKDSLRRSIRQAGHQYVISNEPALLPQLHLFHKNTLAGKQQAQHHSEEMLRKLMNAAVAQQQSKLYAAHDLKGELQALLWNAWDQESSYYLMGARSPQSDSHRAMSLLLWQAIKDAQARGNNYFDFEGSMDPGVERFFRKFGARRELYLVLKKENSWLWRMKQQLFR